MRIYLLVVLILAGAASLQAQEQERISGGKLNFEFLAGYLNSPPVGVYARQIKEDAKDQAAAMTGYKGKLLPKSSAYTGILVDYKIHPLLGIGTGVMYSPRGWWFFEDFPGGTRVRNYYTVDYFEFPVFLQVYPTDVFWFRLGPVLSFAGITKVRIVTEANGETSKEKYRFGEKGSPLAKELVGGLETMFHFGNPNGAHGSIGVQYAGSVYQNIDIKPVVLRIGFGYTLTK